MTKDEPRRLTKDEPRRLTKDEPRRSKTAEQPRFPGYVLGPRLAVGGHSEVFAARSATTSEDVVLKVPLPEVAATPAYAEAVAHEAALGRLVHHRALVRVVDLLEADEGPVLVLERVDGITLAEALAALSARDERVPLGVAIHVVRELLDALATLHEAKDGEGRALGAVHRDVGPRNVLLARDGSVKLVDLGIARSRLRDTRTRTGVVRGTLRYLAPEQATGSTLDARTDLYAVGLLLFELVAGEAFLRGDGELELLRAAEDPAPRPMARGAPSELEPIVARALSRFPEERFASAKGLSRALAPFDGPSDDARARLAELVASVAPTTEGPAHPDPSVEPPSDAMTHASEPAPPSTDPATSTRHTGRAVALGVACLIALGIVGSRRAGTERSEAASPQVSASSSRSVMDGARADVATASPARSAPSAAATEVATRSPAAAPSAFLDVRDVQPAVPRAGSARASFATSATLGRAPDAPARAGASVPTPTPLAPSTEPRPSLDARTFPEAPPAEPHPSANDPVPSTAAVAASSDVPPATGLAPARGVAPPDRASVERKLRHANDALRAARARGEPTSDLDALARGALEAFVEGRYATADVRLDRILARLHAE